MFDLKLINASLSCSCQEAFMTSSLEEISSRKIKVVMMMMMSFMHALKQSNFLDLIC